MARCVPTGTVRVLVLLFLFVLAGGYPSAEEPRPDVDWVPVDSIPPEIVRRGVETKARLQTRIPEMQREALRTIRHETDPAYHQEVRTVTVPLIIDLLDENYRILEFPRDYRVDVTTRLAALETLAFLGGATARGQLRETLSQDGDGAIRAGAAQLMASRPGMTPEEDYAAVSEALYRAVRRSSPESEVIRLLTAAQTLSERVWDPENPQLIQALVLIHEGRYSRSVRSTAMSFLEVLANR
ncbi:MAG: hypothetical protein PF508_18060 [Spirochaeta sp.]|nr:hypothetical protein [Spirochaeta sp.]